MEYEKHSIQVVIFDDHCVFTDIGGEASDEGAGPASYNTGLSDS